MSLPIEGTAAEEHELSRGSARLPVNILVGY